MIIMENKTKNTLQSVLEIRALSGPIYHTRLTGHPKGLKKDQFEIAFPWRFAILMKTLRFLPDFLYFRVAKKIMKDRGS